MVCDIYKLNKIRYPYAFRVPQIKKVLFFKAWRI
jgi:hypothetical protein